MTELSTRLRHLEQKPLERGQALLVRVLFDDELRPCREHANCLVEADTAVHHAGVIRLSFSGQPE